MLVQEYMTKDPIVMQPDQSIFRAKATLQEKRIRHLPVVVDRVLAGVLTQTDVLAASLKLAQSPSAGPDFIAALRSAPIGDHMTVEPVSVSADCSLQKAACLLRDRKIGCLPVVDDAGQVRGIITETDLFDALAEMLGFFGDENEPPSAAEGEAYTL